jgi:hypothetical protein
MRTWGQLIGLLALVLYLLPALTAQEEKKVADKSDEKKEEKTEPEKKKEPAEEKFVYGVCVPRVKLLRSEGGEFSIEVQVLDPQKVYDMEVWKVGQLQNLARQTNPQQYAQQFAQYQVQLAQRVLTSPKSVDVKAGEGMKVRLMNPPLLYDDQGNLKKWTAKTLAAYRGKSKWPGTYPGEVDMLKPGQWVDVYISKSSVPTPPKGPARPKKKGDVEAEIAAATMKPEVVLIVVIQEAPWK